MYNIIIINLILGHIKPEKLLCCPKCIFVTEYKHHLEYHLRNHYGKCIVHSVQLYIFCYLSHQVLLFILDINKSIYRN